MRIVWNKSAVANLESIKVYIAQDSQHFAVELVFKGFCFMTAPGIRNVEIRRGV